MKFTSSNKYAIIRQQLKYGYLFMRKYGFSLAEVLIALTIIGVIAAITIPIAINNYTTEQTVAKLKKAYSSVEQALRMSQATNGPLSTWDFTIRGDKFISTYLYPYLHLKEGKIEELNNTTQYKFINRKPYTNALLSMNGYYIALSDGAILIVDGWYDASLHRRGIAIDLNGYKKPNILGIDVFQYYISENGLITPCYDQDMTAVNNDCNKSSSDGGRCCSDRIMRNSWQILPDYPW